MRRKAGICGESYADQDRRGVTLAGDTKAVLLAGFVDGQLL